MVIYNDYLPELSIQTDIGDISAQVKKIRDRSGNGVSFSSVLLPPYLKRTLCIGKLWPWFSLRDLLTGDD